MNGAQREAEESGDSLDSPAAARPLRIVVTGTAREQLALQTLARNAIPMLRRPSAFTNKQRHQLAQAFAEVVDAPYADEPEEPGDTDGGEWP